MARRGAVPAVAVLATLCALVLFAAQAAAATGSISGAVTDADANLPVAGAEVCAWDVGGAAPPACALTQSDDGTYAIEGLAAGDYIVEFWPGEANQELARQFFDGARRWEEAEVISLADGEARTGVDADLELGSTIAGNVFDATLGRSVEGIWVCSIDAVNDELLICDKTNVNGNYGIPFLPTGSYKVVFSPDARDWGVGFLAEDDGYPTRFWNEASSVADAFAMSIGPSWFVGGIDVRYGAPPPAVGPPAITLLASPQVRKPRRCKKGYRKKLVRGKRRCVRRKHRRRKQHRLGAAPRFLVG